MNIKKIILHVLRNDEHFMLQTEFKELLDNATAVKTAVQPRFTAYCDLLDKEDDGLKKISKSALTARIHDEDKARDELYAGMAEMCRAYLRHPSANKRAAAGRLKIVFDTYGNITVKPLNEQTSAIINILQEFKGAKYADDVAYINLNDYVTPLEQRNNLLETLVRERYDEVTAKSAVVLKDARIAVDEAYHDLVARIEALNLLQGGADFESFIRSLNTVIAKYKAILAARMSRHHHGRVEGVDVDVDGGVEEVGDV